MARLARLEDGALGRDDTVVVLRLRAALELGRVLRGIASRPRSRLIASRRPEFGDAAERHLQDRRIFLHRFKTAVAAWLDHARVMPQDGACLVDLLHRGPVARRRLLTRDGE